MTKIEWCRNPDGTAGEVWNIVDGCTPVSAGCDNCYACTMAGRFWKKRKFSDVQFHPERSEIPLHWKKPRMIFVDSMGDLFHDKVDFYIINRIMRIMKQYVNHTFIILTKRPKRMLEYFTDPLGWRHFSAQQFSDVNNIWLGVSVENQQTADERIPVLLLVPAAKRFVSYEPALGAVDLEKYINLEETPCDKSKDGMHCEHWYEGERCHDCGSGGIDWVIAGGETGRNARPCHPDWIRSVRDQCEEAGVPFFLKNMQIDGKEWKQFPEDK